jgi:membrane-bound lytic murein transglycosylase D
LKRFSSLYVVAGTALLLLAVVTLVAALPDSYRVQAGLQSMSVRSAAGAPDDADTDDADTDAAPEDAVLVHDRSTLDLLSFPEEEQEAAAQPLTEAQVLKRLGRLYHYRAGLLEARAEGDEEHVGALLDEAMRDLDALARRPGLWKDERFQQLYGHLAGAYRAHYGAPDTLSATRGEIFATRDSLFGAVETARLRTAVGLSDAPLLDQTGADALAPQATEVAMPVNSLTRGAMRFLQREPEDHVYRWMRRMETYFPMIEHIFAEEDVPDELKYLAMVESGLNPKAESWASAAGIWQFIPATGRAYGLEITPYVDERMNPEKATRAAAAHLKDLYRMFGGDWHLALSGYNCSPTRIRQAIRKVRRQGLQPTFWNIYPYIPRETRNYVPTYVAAALMLSNPQHFDLKRVQPGPRYRFDRVPVRGMLPLDTAAELADTTVKQLRALNPSLRKDVLPPSAEPFALRVPYGTYAQFAAGYRALPDSAKGLTLAHRVRAGETPGGIAERYGVSLEALQQANALGDRLAITAGDRLVVPAAGSRGAGGLLTADDAPPRRVQYSTRTLRPLVATGGSLPGGRPQAGGGAITTDVTTYHVRRGYTLYGIARRHDVSLSDLYRWNELSSGSDLQPGQKLTVRS